MIKFLIVLAIIGALFYFFPIFMSVVTLIGIGLLVFCWKQIKKLF